MPCPGMVRADGLTVACTAQTCVQRSEAGSVLCLIGCIAEVKKVKWQRDGTCHALTRGRQRVAFCPDSFERGAAGPNPAQEQWHSLCCLRCVWFQHEHSTVH